MGLIDRHIDEPELFARPQNPQQQSALPPAPAPPVVPALPPFVGPGVPPPQYFAHSGSRQRGQSSGSSGSGRRRKKRKKERKYRNPPHPLENTFDEQLAYFLSLDYEDYVQWWKRHGAVNPGPSLPPGASPPPAPMALPPPPVAAG